MLGSIDPQKKQVVVVGAGVSGLLWADHFSALGYQVDLYEASTRAGGLIESRTTARGLVERAAHSLLVTPEIEAWFEHLGVKLVGVNPGSRARFIVRGGRMRRMPLRIFEIFGALVRVLFARVRFSESSQTQTLRDWALKHVGAKAEAYLLSPFVRGVYAARTSELSVQAAFPRLAVPAGHSLLSRWIAERVTRRLPAPPRGGARRMVAPRDGMSSLTDALLKRAQTRPGFRFHQGVTLSPSDLSTFKAANRIIATDASAAAALLESESAGLASLLRALPYAPLITVTVFARRDQFVRPPQGVGVLIPECETGWGTLGVLFNASSFQARVADLQDVSLTVMLGGTSTPEALRESDEQLRTRIRRDLERLFGLIDGAKLDLEITRWSRAIPVYGAACLEFWSAARESWCAISGNVLVGNYTGQVSLRGMIEEVIAHGRK
jgi:oxygen-dependent protoporphyrinogen oxidase